jgi:hypothetical protein
VHRLNHEREYPSRIEPDDTAVRQRSATHLEAPRWLYGGGLFSASQWSLERLKDDALVVESPA